MNERKDEMTLISAVCDRALAAPVFKYVDKLSLLMDIDNTHKVHPMDLQKLLDFPDGDFFHDVVGIWNHLDRKTLTLNDFFSPRCTR